MSDNYSYLSHIYLISHNYVIILNKDLFYLCMYLFKYLWKIKFIKLMIKWISNEIVEMFLLYNQNKELNNNKTKFYY